MVYMETTWNMRLVLSMGSQTVAQCRFGVRRGMSCHSNKLTPMVHLS